MKLKSPKCVLSLLRFENFYYLKKHKKILKIRIKHENGCIFLKYGSKSMDCAVQ